MGQEREPVPPNELSDLLGTAVPLVDLRLLKTTMDDGDKPWAFAGIASDESKDTEGDAILKKHLDVSYADQRGYVNWDHSREPRDQIGFLTKCAVIEGSKLEEVVAALGLTTLSKSASVFVTGELYKHVPRAQEVRDIMRSVPAGHPGLGISLDGAIAREAKTRAPVRAIVRGIAFTPIPAQPRTVSVLMKSLLDAPVASDSEFDPAMLDLVAQRVLRELKAEQLVKSAGMTHDDAVLWVMKKRPHWPYQFAARFVTYTMSKAKRI